MSDVNDRNSDSSSEYNWSPDSPCGRHDDRVIFENVADQYVKDADVTAFFTVLQGVKINPTEDQIGLLRIGCTNIKECLAYAPVQLNPSIAAGAILHGTATFPSSVLPATDDEFYQFCYINNKTKNLGSSIPFQLNCAPDEIDLLSNTPIRKTKGDGLVAVPDNDNDEFIVVQTKSMLTEERLRQENRALLETNIRLEAEKDEYKTKFNLLEVKSKEHCTKMFDELQALTSSYKTALEEVVTRKTSETALIKEYNECRALCVQYKSESGQNAERCKALETSYETLTNEFNQLRSQSAITSQFTKEQATQIIDLERRLMQANELAKGSEQHQAALEQRINDLRLSAGRNQEQMESYVKQIAEKDEAIVILEKTNSSLQEEVRTLTNEHQSLSSSLKAATDLADQLRQQLDEMHEQHRLEIEASQKEIESYKSQLNEMNSSQQTYVALMGSYKEIERRCVKHQKNEIEAKKKLTAYQKFIDELQHEIQELQERLTTGADEYRTLYRKYASLERKSETNPPEDNSNPVPLTNSNPAPLADSDSNEELLDEILRGASAPQHERNQARYPSIKDIIDNTEREIQECPMCNKQFPPNMALETKAQHIESHFT